MKKMKKIVALLLAMAMTTAIFAGCGKKEEAPAEEPAVEEAVEEEAPAEEEAPVEEEAPAEIVLNTVILKEQEVCVII